MTRGRDADRLPPEGVEVRAAPRSMPVAPSCPFCGGVDTELICAFGSHASVSTYWCRACRSPFEMMKWRSTSR